MSIPVPAEWCLNTRLIGRRILWFDQVESTNTIAADYAPNAANDGLVIIADEQSAGRGKRGRTWLAPPGTSLLLSCLLFPPASARRAVVLTALAAVAVCETVYESTRLQAVIKWPNDVLVRGKKVCGILVEQGQGTVIGIGLNVSTPAQAFAEAGLEHAASLAMFTGSPLDRRTLAETLIRQLDDLYRDLQAGWQSDLESRWRWNSGLLGKQVIVRSQGTDYEGRLLEIGFDRLVLHVRDGPTSRFAPETVELVQLRN